MKEIGSEFWLNQKPKESINLEFPQWLKVGVDNKLLLSGRTAIHFILKDIQKKNRINTVYFPSYCCQSMLQPFINLGIKVIFYDVYFSDGLRFNIDENQDCDVFFAMNHFGFSKGRMDKYIKLFKERNIIVIEDFTHSLLSEKSYNPQSDYLVASIRKWFPLISGGLAVNNNKKFELKQKDETLESMVKIRRLAMLNKGKYMNGDSSVDKRKFLEKYNIANQILKDDYFCYEIDKDSYQTLQNLNLDYIINRRKENVQLIYENLSTNKKFDLFFSELENGDCPIFVPIVFNNKLERDALRRHLIKNRIYCPVHWPIPTMAEEESKTDIYENELSLVTDQRYDTTDTEYLIRRLEDFYE